MRSILANGLAIALAALLAAPALGNGDGGHGKKHKHHDRKHNDTLLAWKDMFGVSGAFLGPANPLRGVEGDELPWEIERSVNGSLKADGRLEIKVRGLVFPEMDPVPPELQGINDEDEFRGLVSCLTVDPAGVVQEMNVVTQGFPANASGDSKIKEKLTLPDPCVAPVVMILAGSEDKWFAATGFTAQVMDDDDDDHDDGHKGEHGDDDDQGEDRD